MKFSAYNKLTYEDAAKKKRAWIPGAFLTIGMFGVFTYSGISEIVHADTGLTDAAAIKATTTNLTTETAHALSASSAVSNSTGSEGASTSDVSKASSASSLSVASNSNVDSSTSSNKVSASKSTEAASQFTQSSDVLSNSAAASSSAVPANTQSGTLSDTNSHSASNADPNTQSATENSVVSSVKSQASIVDSQLSSAESVSSQAKSDTEATAQLVQQNPTPQVQVTPVQTSFTLASASQVTAPPLNQAPALSNFFVSGQGNYILYNASGVFDLFPYSVTNLNKQLYGFYVVLPTSITGQGLPVIQAAADDLVTQMKAKGFSIDSMTAYQLNDTTDGRQVYYFRPNDGANDTNANVSSSWPVLHLPVHTGADVNTTPKTINMNANTMNELASKGVLFAGSGNYTEGGGFYPTLSASSLGINAPDANLKGIVYSGITRTLTYTHATVTDTYNIVDAETNKVIKVLTKVGQDGTQYSRKGFIDSLVALGLDPAMYVNTDININDGTLTDDITLTPAQWSSGQTFVAGHTYTVTVGRVKTSIAGHDSNLIAGPKTTWTASDNFDGATDINGKVLQLSDVKVTGSVNTQVPGDYSVTYGYVDSQGNNVSKKVVVHVTATQAWVSAHDSYLVSGPNTTWTPSDNFDSATDANGKSLQLSDMTVTGNVNPQVTGGYSITYSYVDSQGNRVSRTVGVYVTASKASVKGHDSNLIAGPNTAWTAGDNFDGATDAKGKPLQLSDVKVTGSVNPQVPGDYSVTYSYTDSQGNNFDKTVVVHVTASQASVKGHDSNLIAGPNTTWTAGDNFDGATDANGKPLQLSDVKTTGSVNPQIPGDYSVTYSYVDTQGNNVDKTVIVHVTASQESVTGHDSNLVAGPNTTWTASDNFDGATDANGKALQLSDIKVTGTVNAQVPGDYSVTYSYVDSQGNNVTKMVVVHVAASKISVLGHDSSLIAGPKTMWTLADNFDGATDINGKPLQLNDVTVSGSVNPQVAGDYSVVYSYVDGQGNNVSKTVAVHVLNSQASVTGHDSNLVAGPNTTWTAADNFDGATDITGKPLRLSDVNVTGSVNPQIPGDYSVTYSYVDSQGNDVSKMVVVHVEPSQASIHGHNSNLIAGPNTAWTASDNFDGATDANGKAIQLNDVKVTGNVNPQVPGDYSITYSYVDS
ncbi:bacterial Ig-like domain-containing protein [Furfurilactobacillus cerevisiae]